MAVTFFKPLPCTAGYGGTHYRNGLDLGTAPALNTGAACTAPASSGVGVRGSAHAPRGGTVPDPARPASLPSGSATHSTATDTASAPLPGALALPAAGQGARPDLAALLTPATEAAR
jgi:phospholipid/cholesterol/gamma-HCH transport system substrate-binding protein